jgi:hypothetical protein
MRLHLILQGTRLEKEKYGTGNRWSRLAIPLHHLILWVGLVRQRQMLMSVEKTVLIGQVVPTLYEK